MLRITSRFGPLSPKSIFSVCHLSSLSKSVFISSLSPVIPLSSSFFPARNHGIHSHSQAHAQSSLAGSSSIATIIEQAADLLPNQAILENFVHHNPLQHFETMEFKDALDHVHKLESYMSPGERAFDLTHVDPRKRVNEALSDISSVFLDRGGAKWAPKYRDKGFIFFFATLELLGFAPWREGARVAARRILSDMKKGQDAHVIAEDILKENLEFFGIPQEDWTYAIRSMLLELRGWAGMFRRMETHPEEAPSNAKVRLVEYCAIKSIFVRSSIEALALQVRVDSSIPISLWLSQAPKFRKPKEEIAFHVSAIAYADQCAERREALETEFKHTLLHTINPIPATTKDNRTRLALQLYTCIDDRECSFRRHVESADPAGIETFGIAGFFGIPIRYQPADGREQMILAPEGFYPPSILVERETPADQKAMSRLTKIRRVFARLSLMWENASFSPTGSLILSTVFFPWSIGRLLMMGFSPNFKRTLKEKVLLNIYPKPRTDFQLPFPPGQAATLLARTFKDIGTQNRFAPVVVVLGHGSISVNNPFSAAYNCGACSGREGGPNARLLARLANDKDVRASLSSDHGIDIPDDTIFIGGNHNTTADTVEFFDIEALPLSHVEHFKKDRHIIEQACGKNALERCHRFFLAEHIKTPEEALWHVQTRSTDAAEIRPELNHATNAAVIVGRRDLTKGRFLDRRVFLPSYDPLSDDDNGTNLEHVLGPALLVCSGINLEYLFSTIDMDHHGAGTKAPLNVVGNIGVLQGTAGDLRPGLPSQMTEMHTPIRALYVVDAPIKRVEAVLARRPELYRLVYNEWVRFFVRDPQTNQFFKQIHGQYLPISVDEMAEPYVTFNQHRSHGLDIAHRENAMYWAATTGMLAACGLPIYMFEGEAMNVHGPLVAACGTLLSLPVLAFARRYLHGEFMFGRFSILCMGLLLGFNLVANAPSVEHALAGWSLFGFASTFLIGAYNDRPTVRNNATFAFAAYRFSDLAMLVAATFSAHHLAVEGGGFETNAVVAGGLVLAALFKSSQFPLTGLFARSMEGPTPASALGYAGLSAHIGVVLLAGTLPLWFGFDWARIALGSIGIITAVYSSLVSRIRADRKGAIAYATSATLGLIFVLLACGFPEAALLTSLGHAAFRMTQILRSPNVITDWQKLRTALGYMPWPKVVPDWLYRLSWRFHRFNSDFHFLHLLHILSRRIYMAKPWKLTKLQQWIVTAVIVVLAGAPFTPLNHYIEELLMELLKTEPYLAAAIMSLHFVISVILIRFLFLNVLDPRRFQLKTHQLTKPPSTKKLT